VVLLVGGCASVYPPQNKPVSEIDESSGYRRLSIMDSRVVGENLVLLAFSGGGTRAAALSYGVMQELRDTELKVNGEKVSLLDHVEVISSVSGGSFTSAYYGLYRNQLFTDYEDDFLRKGVQDALIHKMLSPGQWPRSISSGIDRTEMAVDYYDRSIFKGATFEDLSKNGPPFIDINATDLSTGMRFTFTQELFDLICSDLSSFPIARAVTASSAVPVAFPSVVLENHAEQCDVSDTLGWKLIEQTRPVSNNQQALLDGIKSYRDSDERPYIHLVDGGIADNLGLRTLISRIESLSTAVKFDLLQSNRVENILIILVNAQAKHERLIDKSAEKPSASKTMSACVAAQMSRYNHDTLDQLRLNIERFDNLASDIGYAVKVHFAQVNFEAAESEEIRAYLNGLPTSLQLNDGQIDRLIAAGRYLLRTEPSFLEFKRRANAETSSSAISKEALFHFFSNSSD